MGFFQTFWSWLNTTLTGYIGNNTAHVATALEPVIVTLSTIYLMGWGYLQLTGRTEETLASGIKRIVVLVVVLGVAVHLWLYNALIVDTFYVAPAQLAAAVIGSSDPVDTIDAIWQRGGSVAEQLWDKGGVFSGEFGFYLAGAIVWILIGLLCVYAMFLISLSSIASAVLLAIGPLFVAMLLFDSTRRYFEAWIAQLANYALISILTVMVSALLLQIVESYAAQTAARGTAILTVDALDMMLISLLVFLLMRQVMPIAASLAGGLALSSFGVVSRAMAWSSKGGQGLIGEGVVRATATTMDRISQVASSRRSAPSVAPSWRED